MRSVGALVIGVVSGLTNRRVIDECTEEAVSAIRSPRMRGLALAQPAIDELNDEFAPSWGDSSQVADAIFETVPGIGRLTLATEVGRGTYATVFSVVERSDLVIKYQANCLELKRRVHPLLVDYWLAKVSGDTAELIAKAQTDELIAAGDTNAYVRPTYPTARVYFVSPPGALPKSRDKRTNFSSSLVERRKCTDNGGVVRFLVMERVTNCLATTVRGGSVSGVLGPESAIGVTAGVVEVVERLHATGVIHGDIHQGNVCRRESAPGDGWVLIDLGMGSFVDSETDVGMALPEANHQFLTPWQLEGKALARRDDMYSCLHLGADLILGPALNLHALSLIRTIPRTPTHKRDPSSPQIRGKDTSALLAWKRDGNIFRTPIGDPIAELDATCVDESDRIDASLRGLLRRVSGLVSVTDPIPYQSIKGDLLNIQQLMTVCEVSTGPDAHCSAGWISDISLVDRDPSLSSPSGVSCKV